MVGEGYFVQRWRTFSVFVPQGLHDGALRVARLHPRARRSQGWVIRGRPTIGADPPAGPLKSSTPRCREVWLVRQRRVGVVRPTAHEAGGGSWLESNSCENG